MKKKMIIAATIIAALSMIAGLAWACPGCGYHSGHGGSGGPGYHGNQSQHYQEFQNETAPLREKLAAKQGEYNALMAQDNPNSERAAQLQHEISRLQDRIQSKAQSYNMSYCPGAQNHSAHWGSRNNHGGWCW